MAELDEKRFTEIITDEMLVSISEALSQFSGLLDQMSSYARQKSSENATHPGQELYWGGFVDGLSTAAALARETRPLRGVK
jgi:hypothetical protein